MKGKNKSPLYILQNRSDKSGMCDMCTKFSDFLSVDHIFPASLLLMWGLKEEVSTDAENLQLVCRACAILKGAHFDFHNPKTIPLIEKYIKLLKDNYEY